MKGSEDLLKKYAVSKSKFFSLADGEENTVKYLHAEKVPNHFDRGETECIRYHLEVDGTELLWDRTSRELARQMGGIPEGSTIYIKRIGQKNKTKYEIRRIE